MQIIIYLLAGVGVIASLLVLIFGVSHIMETHRDNIHLGLQEQIARLGEKLTTLMQSQGALTPQAEWLIEEFTYTARSRHSKTSHDLVEGFESANASVEARCDGAPPPEKTSPPLPPTTC